MKLRNAITFVVLVEAAAILLGIAFNGWSIDALQIITRYSGRFSLFLFSFIFLLYPLKKSTLSGFLSENYFLVFAIAHGIHLLELMSYVTLSGIELIPFRLAGGFVAYVLIFLMPWWQYQFIQGKINETRINLSGYVYVFYVWLIFFMTYLGRLTKGLPNGESSTTEQIVLMSWVCIMLVIKIVSLFISKKKNPA